MSEFEIEKRQEYVRNRKKWMMIQIVALALVAAIALGSFIIYDRMNRTYYIEYTESSSIDYHIQYIENEFFEDWLEKDQAYISSLVDTVSADFKYILAMDANDIGFDYNYQIVGTLMIADKDSGNPYYTTEDILLPKIEVSTFQENHLKIEENILVDFNQYNDFASHFIKVYNLTNASCTLYLTLDVEVVSSCPDFEQNNENVYSTSLKIPLALDTFHAEITSSVPTNESRVLACKDTDSRGLFLGIGIIASILAFVLLIVLLVFLHLTKNEDITYVARVRKILNAYRSFIQRMDGEFDDRDYQILMIQTFTELLGIRDTLQAPILMTENRDETMTRFLIPTESKLLYVFEVKVDNYDMIYEKHEDAEQELLLDKEC
ncbi:MAG: hypothetical protein IJ489_11060 [Clostridia bacterium]|nr:hypothetical protein [Clostridia bacterium]